MKRGRSHRPVSKSANASTSSRTITSSASIASRRTEKDDAAAASIAAVSADIQARHVKQQHQPPSRQEQEGKDPSASNMDDDGNSNDLRASNRMVNSNNDERTDDDGTAPPGLCTSVSSSSDRTPTKRNPRDDINAAGPTVTAGVNNDAGGAPYDIPCANGICCHIFRCPYLHIPAEDYYRNDDDDDGTSSRKCQGMMALRRQHEEHQRRYHDGGCQGGYDAVYGTAAAVAAGGGGIECHRTACTSIVRCDSNGEEENGSPTPSSVGCDNINTDEAQENADAAAVTDVGSKPVVEQDINDDINSNDKPDDDINKDEVEENKSPTKSPTTGTTATNPTMAATATTSKSKKDEATERSNSVSNSTVTVPPSDLDVPSETKIVKKKKTNKQIKANKQKKKRKSSRGSSRHDGEQRGDTSNENRGAMEANAGKTVASPRTKKKTNLDACATEFFPQTPPSTPPLTKAKKKNASTPSVPLLKKEDNQSTQYAAMATAASTSVPMFTPPSPPSLHRKAAKNGIKRPSRERSGAFDLSEAVSSPPEAWPSPSRFHGADAEVMKALLKSSDHRLEKGSSVKAIQAPPKNDRSCNEMCTSSSSFLDAADGGLNAAVALPGQPNDSSGFRQGTAVDSGSFAKYMPSPKKKSRKFGGKGKFARKGDNDKENEKNGVSNLSPNGKTTGMAQSGIIKPRGGRADPQVPIGGVESIVHDCDQPSIEECLENLCDMGFSGSIIKSVENEFRRRKTSWTSDDIINWALHLSGQEVPSASRGYEGVEESKCEDCLSNNNVLPVAVPVEGNDSDPKQLVQEGKIGGGIGDNERINRKDLSSRNYSEDEVFSAIDEKVAASDASAQKTKAGRKKRNKQKKKKKTGKKTPEGLTAHGQGVSTSRVSADSDKLLEVKEISAEAKARADFWEKERAHEKRYTEVMTELCIHEYARLKTAERRSVFFADDVKENEVFVQRLERECQKAYRIMYGSRTGGSVKLVGSADSNIIGRFGKIVGWDETLAKYRVELLPTKGQKMAKQAMLVAGNSGTSKSMNVNQDMDARECVAETVCVSSCDIAMTQTDGSRKKKGNARNKKGKKAAVKNVVPSEYTFVLGKANGEYDDLHATIPASVLDELQSIASDPSKLSHAIESLMREKNAEEYNAEQREKDKLSNAVREKKKLRFKTYDKSVNDLRRKARRIRSSPSDTDEKVDTFLEQAGTVLSGASHPYLDTKSSEARALLRALTDGVRDYFLVNAAQGRYYEDIMPEILSYYQGGNPFCGVVHHFDERNCKVHFLFQGHPIAYVGFEEVFPADVDAFLVKEDGSEDLEVLLGLAPDASEKEIRKAYKKMALVYHPDNFRTTDVKTRKEAEDRLKRALNAMHRVLSKFPSENCYGDV